MESKKVKKEQKKVDKPDKKKSEAKKGSFYLFLIQTFIFPILFSLLIKMLFLFEFIWFDY